MTATSTGSPSRRGKGQGDRTLLTVTLNAAVDKIYTVPGFTLDKVHRPVETRVVAGGKGINVARVYQTLGGTAKATGFLGGRNGEYISQVLSAENIPQQFVKVSQESRLCMAILDPIAGTQTELNENGPEVGVEDCNRLITCLRELLPGSDAVILSGSIPPGTPPTIYRDIITLAQDEFGVRAVLDTSGEALALGVTARPFLVKPNVHELAALGVASAQELRLKYGVTLAMVTAGSRGAILASAEGVWEAAPPQVEVLSAVGSGDTLLAAFLYSLNQGSHLAQALEWGVAAGAANATTYGSGFCSRVLIEDLAGRTRANKIA